MCIHKPGVPTGYLEAQSRKRTRGFSDRHQLLFPEFRRQPLGQVPASCRHVTTHRHWCSPDGRDAVRFILTLATVPTAPTSRFYTNATAQTKHN